MKQKSISLILVLTLLIICTTSAFADVQPPWTENVEMRNETNYHFQVYTSAAIATALVCFIAPTSAPGIWTGLSSAIYSNSVCTETHNVYFKIRYYYRYSGNIYLPYYIKQTTYAYSNPERTDFVGVSSRYYYSTMPY